MTIPINTTRLREACVDVEAAAAAVAAAEKARDNAKPRAKERAQVALFRADDNLTRAAFVLAENRASILALLDEVERLRALFTDAGQGEHDVLALIDYYQDQALEAGKAPVPRPIDEWHEDYGSVLWWTLPVCEPPYAGAPGWSDWLGYHTHWTPIVYPREPEEGGTR